jgi:hypothetical protein
MYLDMVYPKHHPRIWNANNFLNPKVESWYVNFLGASHFHTIPVSVSREVVRKISSTSIVVIRSYTIPLDTLYAKHVPRLWNSNSFVCHKHDPRRWNDNYFVKPKVEIWYVNFLRVLLLHMISIWVPQKIVRRLKSMHSTMVYTKHDDRISKKNNLVKHIVVSWYVNFPVA